MALVDGIEDGFLDHIHASIYVIEASPDGIPIYRVMNKHGFRALGLSQNDVIGKTAKQIFPGHRGEEAYDRHVAAIQSGKKAEYSISLVLKGIEQKFTTTLVPTFDTSGKVTSLVGISIDQTPPAKETLPMPDMNAMANDVEKFIAFAAHDLRTPMRNVKILTEMVLEDFKDLGDGKVEMIEMLSSLAESAMRMISELLTVVHTTETKEKIVTFDLSLLCSDILATLDPAGRHKVQCEPRTLLADRLAFQIILRNLIDNAFKHAGKDVVTLSIAISAVKTGRIEVLVRDNGSGFPDPTIAFLDGGDLRPCSGFGLVGIRRMIEARNGKISADPVAAGGGAIIRFELPGDVLA